MDLKTVALKGHEVRDNERSVDEETISLNFIDFNEQLMLGYFKKSQTSRTSSDSAECLPFIPFWYHFLSLDSSLPMDREIKRLHTLKSDKEDVGELIDKEELQAAFHKADLAVPNPRLDECFNNIGHIRNGYITHKE
ncbi:hypothetical protein HD806DRAFT_552246 [Xylariaceae sp. AK1471]|nr:hypothetical protein HD806DRAFT_552246 [Xylariaceae sp. AK1471]